MRITNDMIIIKKLASIIFLIVLMINQNTLLYNSKIDSAKNIKESINVNEETRGNDTIYYKSEEVLELYPKIALQMPSGDEIKFEDIKFINTEIYKEIEIVNSEINYFGEFSRCEDEIYDFYRQKFHSLIVGENSIENIEYWNPNEYEIDKAEEYLYYFFDMDNDEVPELTVSLGTRYMYIFKYDAESDIFNLWHIRRAGDQLLGDNKVSYWMGGVGFTQGLHELSNNGEFTSEVIFYGASFYNNILEKEDEIYLIGFKGNSNSWAKLSNLKEKLKEHVYYSEAFNTYNFRLTPVQYNELRSEYIRSQE